MIISVIQWLIVMQQIVMVVASVSSVLLSRLSLIVVQYIVVVVASAHLDLREVAPDSVADQATSPKIHRGSFNRADPTGRNGLLIYFCISICVQTQFVAEDVSLTVEIKISVVREVQYGVFVSIRVVG